MMDTYKTWLFILTFLSLLLATYSYHAGKNREAYMECLRVTEKLLAADPKRFSAPYCRL